MNTLYKLDMFTIGGAPWNQRSEFPKNNTGEGCEDKKKPIFFHYYTQAEGDEGTKRYID